MEARTEAIIKRYEDFVITEEPYWEPVGEEILDFELAYEAKHPLALIGPTGCGKTTLATHMAYKFRLDLTNVSMSEGELKATTQKFSEAEQQTGGGIAFPYIEVSCHEDMTETYLVGRWGIDGNWIPGPLYTAATHGGMLVLDEIVEARKDVTVLIHPLTDDRRVLPVSKKGEVIMPPDHFMLVICYNPGYQIKAKNLKPSTRQRFPTLNMDYAPAHVERKIIIEKTGVDEEIADKLVNLAGKIRAKKADDDSITLQEGASTRLLIRAADWYERTRKKGKEPDLAHIVKVNVFNPISDEDTTLRALEELLKAF